MVSHEDSFWQKGKRQLESSLFTCVLSERFLIFSGWKLQKMSVNVSLFYIFRHDPSPCQAFVLLLHWHVSFFPVKTAKTTSYEYTEKESFNVRKAAFVEVLKQSQLGITANIWFDKLIREITCILKPFQFSDESYCCVYTSIFCIFTHDYSKC